MIEHRPLDADENQWRRTLAVALLRTLEALIQAVPPQVLFRAATSNDSNPIEK